MEVDLPRARHRPALCLDLRHVRSGHVLHTLTTLHWHRRTRLITALFALLSLLCVQWAMAGYVCPAEKAATQIEARDVQMANAPCCDDKVAQVDEAPAGLCHAHCHAGQPSLDKHELPSPVALDAMPADFTVAPMPAMHGGVPLQLPHLTRATAPPLSIRNCCLRI